MTTCILTVIGELEGVAANGGRHPAAVREAVRAQVEVLKGQLERGVVRCPVGTCVRCGGGEESPPVAGAR